MSTTLCTQYKNIINNAKGTQFYRRSHKPTQPKVIVTYVSASRVVSKKVHSCLWFTLLYAYLLYTQKQKTKQQKKSLQLTLTPTTPTPTSTLIVEESVAIILTPQADTVTPVDIFCLLDELTGILKCELNKRLKQNNHAKTFTIKISHWMQWFIKYNNYKAVSTYITRNHTSSLGKCDRECLTPLLGANWWSKQYNAHTEAECQDSNIPRKYITHNTTMEILPSISITHQNSVLTVSGKVRCIPPGGLRYVDTDLQ